MSAVAWGYETNRFATGEGFVVDAPRSNKSCCGTFGMGKCQERVGNTWDGSLDLVDKLGYVKLDDAIPDGASCKHPVLFRVRSSQPDAVALLILRSTALLSPSTPIMVNFEPHDVAPGQVATPLQGGTGSWGFLSPTDLAGKLHSMVHPLSVERLTYQWISLVECKIVAVEDVTARVLLCRARGQRDVAFDLARNFSKVTKPRAAAQTGGRRKRVRKDGIDGKSDASDDDVDLDPGGLCWYFASFVFSMLGCQPSFSHYQFVCVFLCRVLLYI